MIIMARFPRSVNPVSTEIKSPLSKSPYLKGRIENTLSNEYYKLNPQ
jgi:hypothetical protein